MKKILFIALAMLTLFGQTNAVGQESSKKSKGIKWEWDGKTLSGNTEIDTYIKTIDTLYNKVQGYTETLDKYKMVTERFELNGKKYELAYMLDEQGQIVTRGTVNWQCVQAIMQGTNIVLDMTNASLMSANAALTLPKLGFKAFKFGKYVKGGPAVISAGTKAIKDVRKRWINNSRTWKDMKVDAIKDPKSIGYTGMTDELASKLNKCCYIKEVKEFSETKDETKSEGQVVSEAASVFNTIATTQQAAEDARKSNEEMEGFDDLVKDAEKDA